MQGKKILIVDDKEAMRKLVELFLEAKGVDNSRIVKAVDGLDAWEKFSNEPVNFCLIITDIDMPRMDGLKLIQKVHANYLGIVTVYMSGRPVVSGLAGTFFLPKPFDVNQFWESVKDYV